MSPPVSKNRLCKVCYLFKTYNRNLSLVLKIKIMISKSVAQIKLFPIFRTKSNLSVSVSISSLPLPKSFEQNSFYFTLKYAETWKRKFQLR